MMNGCVCIPDHKQPPTTQEENSPAQLIFNKDMIMQIQKNVDWQRLKQKRLTAEEKNYKNENKSRIQHEYKVGDQILIVHLQ